MNNDRRCDIYCLSESKINGLFEKNNPEPNLLRISRKDATKHGLNLYDEELYCNNCSRIVPLVYNNTKGQFCPPCFLKIFKGSKPCDICGKKVGCSACGGTTKKMYHDEEKLLCDNSRCLSIFGYQGLEGDLKCTCEMEAVHHLSKHLSQDITQLMNEYLASYHCIQRIGKHHKLSLKYLQSYPHSSCLYCRVKRQYIPTSTLLKIRARNVVCMCYEK